MENRLERHKETKRERQGVEGEEAEGKRKNISPFQELMNLRINQGLQEGIQEGVPVVSVRSSQCR